MRKEEKEAVKSFLIDYDKLAGDAEGMYQEVLDDAINIGDFSGKYDKKEYRNQLINMHNRHLDAIREYNEACFKKLGIRSGEEINDKVKEELNDMLSQYSNMIPVIQSDYQDFFIEMLSFGNFGNNLQNIAKRMKDIKKDLDTRKREMSKSSQETIQMLVEDKAQDKGMESIRGAFN